MSARRPLLPLLVTLALIGLTAGPAPAAQGPEGTDLATARKSVDGLASALKSSRTKTNDLLAALDATAEQYHALDAAADPASDDARLRRLASKIRAAAEKLFLKALHTRKVNARKDPRLNEREVVNVRAAAVLAATGNAKLYRDVRKIIEGALTDAKHDVGQELWDAAFDAAVKLGGVEALEWIAAEYIHTRSSPAYEVDRLVAAHKTFLLFTAADLPGKLRHHVVDHLVRIYASTESTAKRSSTDPQVVSTRRLWDRIRTVVITVVQRYAGTPRDDRGVALATMVDLREWFRDHKSLRDPVWDDPAEGG
jgi:hypothetical protein